MIETNRKQKNAGNPKPLTEKRLEKIALVHIDRYATSIENLRNVLMRRVEKSARTQNIEKKEAEKWINIIITKLVNLRLLNDQAYAENRARSLHRSGASQKKIMSILINKGISKVDIASTISLLENEYFNRELMAAINYARKRRLGPYRLAEKRREKRDRDLASLARAGFQFNDAKSVIDAISIEVLETEILSKITNN
ncbi:MAG: RecX family transcriptional regulator [Alphaproteobacteria bacterium]|nr:RecX family transcriptional regulator [Alphaproteobacteria bacterium]